MLYGKTTIFYNYPPPSTPIAPLGGRGGEYISTYQFEIFTNIKALFLLSINEGYAGTVL